MSPKQPHIHNRTRQSKAKHGRQWHRVQAQPTPPQAGKSGIKSEGGAGGKSPFYGF